MSDPWSWSELQEAASCQFWMLGTEIWSSLQERQVSSISAPPHQPNSIQLHASKVGFTSPS